MGKPIDVDSLFSHVTAANEPARHPPPQIWGLPAGAMLASAHDLCEFMKTLLNRGTHPDTGRVLVRAETLDTMLSPHNDECRAGAAAGPDDSPMGYAFMLTKRKYQNDKVRTCFLVLWCSFMTLVSVCAHRYLQIMTSVVRVREELLLTHVWVMRLCSQSESTCVHAS